MVLSKMLCQTDLSYLNRCGSHQSYVTEGSQGTKGTTEDVISTELNPTKAFSRDTSELCEGRFFQLTEVNIILFYQT